MGIEKAVDTLIEALNKDEDYKHGWQCNIAVCMMDAWSHNPDKRDDIHFIANEGAKYFLNILTHDGNGTKDLPGALAAELVQKGEI